MRLSRRQRRKRRLNLPALRFTPTAWAKFVFLRDRGPTEVGAFGISDRDDLLLVRDVVLVRQTCTAITVAFNDEAVADLFDAQVDRGLTPQQFARVWLHTHPGDSPTPSRTDEATFERVFGPCDWAVMGILACGGESYARLRFSTGPGGEFEIPVEVDFAPSFPGSDAAAWEAEYTASVMPVMLDRHGDGGRFVRDLDPFDTIWDGLPAAGFDATWIDSDPPGTGDISRMGSILPPLVSVPPPAFESPIP